MSFAKNTLSKFTEVAEKFQVIPQTLARLIIGFVFIESGWGNLSHIEKVIDYFTSLGIPAPHLQAPFVASVELLGGLAIFLGIGTRLASIPLIGIMVVALVTAKREDITELNSLFGLSEFLYIALLIWLITNGAGALSLDRIIKKRCANNGAI